MIATTDQDHSCEAGEGSVAYEAGEGGEAVLSEESKDGGS